MCIRDSRMNSAIPTPNNTLVTGPENELAAVSRNGVLVPPNWLARCMAVGEPLLMSSLRPRRTFSDGPACRDCCWEICFFERPGFSKIGRILTSIGPILVPRMRRFQQQNFHHKRNSRSFDPLTHPGYPDADRSLGNSFS